MESQTALSSTKNARHPASAILNYAYKVLESSTLMARTSVGLDPCIGFLHRDKTGREALVEAIGSVLSALTAKDDRGFFEHCGYRMSVQLLW